MEKLTIQEEEAMLYIWELGSCFVKDIVAKYPKPAPPYTTVASIVKNLERKQYIRAARVGNTYQYTPLIRESEYKRTFMSGFVRNYFENSYKYNPQIQISAESETKRSIFREKDKTKRSKKESAQHSKSRNKSFVMTSVSAL